AFDSTANPTRLWRRITAPAAMDAGRSLSASFVWSKSMHVHNKCLTAHAKSLTQAPSHTLDMPAAALSCRSDLGNDAATQVSTHEHIDASIGRSAWALSRMGCCQCLYMGGLDEPAVAPDGSRTRSSDLQQNLPRRDWARGSDLQRPGDPG